VFTELGGRPANRLARLLIDGSVDQAFQSPFTPTNTVSVLSVPPDGSMDPNFVVRPRWFMPAEVTQIFNLLFRRFVTGGVRVEGCGAGVGRRGGRRLQIGDTAGCKPALRVLGW
jgi:hypothetical protein